MEGLILLNPWVRTDAGEAKAYLRHYYLQRLFNKELLKKVLSGRFEFKKSWAALLENLNKSRGAPVEEERGGFGEYDSAPLPERIYHGLQRFDGWVKVIISGDDLTAAEFNDMVKGSTAWRRLLTRKGGEFFYLPEANHTFSQQVWRDEIAAQTLRWVGR